MNYPASYFVQKFSMTEHPEGGWYKETYRSQEHIHADALPDRFNGKRNFSTAIYFLLEGHQFSSFHRIKSDELWHFYAGGTLNIYVIDFHGELEVIRLGSNLENGEVFQSVVKAGCWFASKPATENSFSLVGCTVSPGFDFSDFELATRDQLSKLYPQQSEIINSLCRS
ncbi:MAG: cupin domain-containing protein [Chitinophagales bacterium]